MTYSKTKSTLICLLVISFCSTGFCGKIVYPFNATTAIVKAGESFTVWFKADAGQNVTSVKLRGPYNSVSISSLTKKQVHGYTIRHPVTLMTDRLSSRFRPRPRQNAMTLS